MLTARSYLSSRLVNKSPPTFEPDVPPRPPPRFILPYPSPTDSKGNEERFAVASGISVTNDSSATMSATLQQRSPLGFNTTTTRLTAPSTPVQIPKRSKSKDTAHPQKQHRGHGDRRATSLSRRPRDVHSRDAIPPSVAALLAVTSIPPPKAARSMRQTKTEKRMTVESIIERAQESEKQLSLKLSKGPMDILMTAPEDLEIDDVSVCDSVPESVTSTQTVPMESMPSLSNSFATDTSFESLQTPPRRRKLQPTRRSLEPVSSPPGEPEVHPLSSPIIAVEDLDFGVFGDKEEQPGKKTSPFKPFKTAFKSNLTASLRALRQAARSFSNLNFSSIPPEDFLTRSLLTIDPQVPYTDERRPPPLEEEPTAALRRYLNPTSLGKPQSVGSGPALRTFTASIQLQTYKVHRARGAASTAGGRSPYPSVGPGSQASQPQPKPVVEYPMPGPRQREARENPDFIRIAVMEMAMRKRGKLDDQRPGRARYALPPRKTSTKPYEISPDGVPSRWVGVSA